MQKSKEKQNSANLGNGSGSYMEKEMLDEFQNLKCQIDGLESMMKLLLRFIKT